MCCLKKKGCTECNFLYSPGKPLLAALKMIILVKEINDTFKALAGTGTVIVNGKYYERIAELSMKEKSRYSRSIERNEAKMKNLKGRFGLQP